MENTLLVITFNAVYGNLQLNIFEKLLVSTIDVKSKFENLPTSARVIAIDLYREYDTLWRHLSSLEFKFHQ